ncbi:MAG: hypothetical protein NZ847_00840, partial [Acidobacteria bacterium]|nr:hypothetical protein [Acidobacteriota bacterium]
MTAQTQDEEAPRSTSPILAEDAIHTMMNTGPQPTSIPIDGETVLVAEQPAATNQGARPTGTYSPASGDTVPAATTRQHPRCYDITGAATSPQAAPRTAKQTTKSELPHVRTPLHLAGKHPGGGSLGVIGALNLEESRGNDYSSGSEQLTVSPSLTDQLLELFEEFRHRPGSACIQALLETPGVRQRIISACTPITLTQLRGADSADSAIKTLTAMAQMTEAPESDEWQLVADPERKHHIHSRPTPMQDEENTGPAAQVLAEDPQHTMMNNDPQSTGTSASSDATLDALIRGTYINAATTPGTNSTDPGNVGSSTPGAGTTSNPTPPTARRTPLATRDIFGQPIRRFPINWPLARPQLTTREERIERPELRQGYTAYIQNVQAVRGLPVLPPCTWCGMPTGGWCDFCTGQGPRGSICSACGGTDANTLARCYDCTRRRAQSHGYDVADHRREYRADDDASDSDDDNVGTGEGLTAEMFDIVEGLQQAYLSEEARRTNRRTNLPSHDPRWTHFTPVLAPDPQHGAMPMDIEPSVPPETDHETAHHNAAIQGWDEIIKELWKMSARKKATGTFGTDLRGHIQQHIAKMSSKARRRLKRNATYMRGAAYLCRLVLEAWKIRPANATAVPTSIRPASESAVPLQHQMPDMCSTSSHDAEATIDIARHLEAAPCHTMMPSRLTTT